MDMGTKRKRSSKVVFTLDTSRFLLQAAGHWQEKKYWGIFFLINEEIWRDSGAKNEEIFFLLTEIQEWLVLHEATTPHIWYAWSKYLKWLKPVNPLCPEHRVLTPPPSTPSYKRSEGQVEISWISKTPLLPPEISEWYSQTISNLCEAALLRRSELPL